LHVPRYPRPWVEEFLFQQDEPTHDISIGQINLRPATGYDISFSKLSTSRATLGSLRVCPRAKRSRPCDYIEFRANGLCRSHPYS
jgi:hypothetical protein